MTRRAKVWRVIAALFAVVNVGGAGVAVASNEPLHAALHVGLLVAAYPVWWLVARRRRRDLPGTQPAEARLDHIEQSLEAIALDVERIGEAQRYAIKVMAERARSAPPESPQ